MMRLVTYCPLCDMDRGQCVHGLPDSLRSAGTERLLISPTNLAHFPGCDHKDDDDYGQWAELDLSNARERLGNGEKLPATRGHAQIGSRTAGASTASRTALGARQLVPRTSGKLGMGSVTWQ